MKYSYRFLKELSGTKKSAEQLARLLMVHAFEVEGIEKFAHGIEGVVIGHVVALAQHPDADKLRVAHWGMERMSHRRQRPITPQPARAAWAATSTAGASTNTVPGPHE